jgi:hypothetical protein
MDESSDLYLIDPSPRYSRQNNLVCQLLESCWLVSIGELWDVKADRLRLSAKLRPLELMA